MLSVIHFIHLILSILKLATYMKIFTVFLFVLVSPLLSISQIDESELNRVITKHFGIEELTSIEENSPDIYHNILYYFKNSFDAQLVECDSCDIEENVLFNLNVFDVTNFESIREQESSKDFVYREKYQITLYSKEEVEAQLGSTINDLINYVEPREFPNWISTGNDEEDYKNYKEKVYKWAEDFPMEYREMTNSSSLRKICISSFKSLSEERREYFFNQEGEYLIID